MSHDLYAAWATAEVAMLVKTQPSNFFNVAPSSISVCAARESGRSWPITDGVINIDDVNKKSYSLSLEFKREAEGLHGLLTAMGQSLAYLHKGFNGTTIVVPSKYNSFSDPGSYLLNLKNSVCPALPIALFTYDEPDPNRLRPFENKIHLLNKVDVSTKIAPSIKGVSKGVETLWGHVREGSTDPHVLFKYLQIAKTLQLGAEPTPDISHISQELINAANNINPNKTALVYLTNCPGLQFQDSVWRKFWIENVLTAEVTNLFKKSNGSYVVINKPTKLIRADGKPKYFFSAKTNSIKDKIVKSLNEGKITEAQAWLEFAKNIHERAHSFREDVDSCLAAMGLLSESGKPTELGYGFVDACERHNEFNTGIPKEILGSALLKNANFGALLHYIYKLSEKELTANPMQWCIQGPKRNSFDKSTYISWIEDQLATNLLVLKKSTKRGGQSRQPLQAELAIMRQYDFISDFRIGLGLQINWPKINQTIEKSIIT